MLVCVLKGEKLEPRVVSKFIEQEGEKDMVVIILQGKGVLDIRCTTWAGEDRGSFCPAWSRAASNGGGRIGERYK